MSFIVGHPTGNANSKAALSGFFDAGLLFEFHTCLAVFPGSILYRLGASGPLSEIQRRNFEIKLRLVTEIHPWREIGRLVALKAGISPLVRHETGFFSVDAVYGSLDKHVSRRLIQAKEQGVKGVYGYEDGSLNSFLKAKTVNMSCIYDLPIGYWRAARRLLEDEKIRRPEW